MNMCIGVIIPAFNEAENLKILLPHLHTVLSGVCNEYEILVIDSRKSADRSEDVCKTNNAKYFRQNDYGYGDAFRTDINKATGEAVLVVDVDNSQDISKIPLMYETFNNGADVVIGSRYVSNKFLHHISCY